MAFNFRGQSKRLFGDTDQLNVSTGEFIGAQFSQGTNESLLSIGATWAQRFMNQSMLTDEEEEKRFGPVLQPDELNKRYGDSGIKFDEPTRDGFAKQRAEARRRFNNRERRIASYEGGLPGAALGLGSRLLGTVANPVDLAATVYFPSAKSIGVSAQLVKAGKMGKAMSAIRKQEPFTDLTEAIWQGTFGNAFIEVPNFLEQRHLQTGYSSSDLVTTLGVGGLFGTGIAVLGRGFKKAMGDSIQEAAAQMNEMNPREIEDMFMGQLDAIMKRRPFNADPHLKLSQANLGRMAEMEEVSARMELLRGHAELQPNGLIRFSGGLNENMLLALASHNAGRLSGDFGQEVGALVKSILREPDKAKKNRLLLDLAKKNEVTYTASATEFPSAQLKLTKEQQKVRARTVKDSLTDNPDGRVIMRDGSSFPVKKKRGSFVGADGKKIDFSQVSQIQDANFRTVSDIEQLFDPHKSLRPYQEEVRKRYGQVEKAELSKASKHFRENGEDSGGRTPEEIQEIEDNIKDSKQFDDTTVAKKDPDVSDLPNMDRTLSVIKEEIVQIADGLDPNRIKAIRGKLDEEFPDLALEGAAGCLVG